MLRPRIAAVFVAAALTAGGLAAPAANAANPIVVSDAIVHVAPEHKIKLTPFDTGCLLDDPTSCEPTEHTPPHHGGGGQPAEPIGPGSYCDAYGAALGDMANTPFGMKQLAELGC